MKIMDDIKAVFFDFDNTLGNRFVYAYRTHCQFIEEFLPDVENPLLFEAMAQDLLTFDIMGNGGVNHALELFEQKYNIAVPVEDYSKWWTDHQCLNVVLNDGVVETLDYLKEKGYLLGVITNGSHASQQGKLDHSGIKEYFEVTVISDDVDIRKPARGIFELAAWEIGVPIEQCLYVGDTFSNDIYGALNAGMKAIWIWPNDLRPLGLDITRIKSFKELKKYL